MRTMSKMTSSLFLIIACMAVMPAWAENTPGKAILVIGASYENAATPFNDALQAPLGGVSVNLGLYLSLGNALARTPLLDGFIINEAQAGATTFDRLSCSPGPACGPAGWQGFDKQFDKALARVTVRDPANPSQIIINNADYILIGLANDCLHAEAFGVPQNLTNRCTTADINAYVDRIIAAGGRALAAGITPIYYKMPDYDKLDLPLMASLYGLAWIVNESEYNQLRDLMQTRVTTVLPQALFVEAWANFIHIGDGLHPSPEAVENAAQRIAKAIRIDRAMKQH